MAGGRLSAAQPRARSDARARRLALMREGEAGLPTDDEPNSAVSAPEAVEPSAAEPLGDDTQPEATADEQDILAASSESPAPSAQAPQGGAPAGGDPVEHERPEGSELTSLPEPEAVEARSIIDEADEHRELAAPNPRGTATTVVTLQMSEAVLDRSFDWQRVRFDQGRELSRSMLWEAALRDLPTDPQEALDLVGSYPDAVYDGGRQQTSARLTPQVHTAIKRLTLELRASRKSRGLLAWEVVSAAIARQLAAEGCGIE